MPTNWDAATLRACPFCGAAPESNDYYVWCKSGQHGLVQVPRSSWNHRAEAAAPLRAVKLNLQRQFHELPPRDGSPYAQGFDYGVLWAIDRIAEAAAPRPVAEQQTADTKAMPPPGGSPFSKGV